MELRVAFGHGECAGGFGFEQFQRAAEFAGDPHECEQVRALLAVDFVVVAGGGDGVVDKRVFCDGGGGAQEHDLQHGDVVRGVAERGVVVLVPVEF